MNNEFILTPIPVIDLMSMFEELLLRVIGKTTPTAPSQDDELLTTKEVATLLKKSKTTIYAWKKAGILPFLKISNKVLYKKHEVLAAPEKIERKKWL